MNSVTSKKSISRLVWLASAALLAGASGASAADEPGDGLAQARALLTGATIARSAASTAAPAQTRSVRPDLDAQELAQRLILGAPRSASDTQSSALSDNRSTIGRSTQGRNRLAYPDAHTLAVRMIAGHAG